MKPYGWTMVLAGVPGVAGAVLLLKFHEWSPPWLIAFIWGTWLLSVAAIALIESRRENRQASDEREEGLRAALTSEVARPIRKLRAEIQKLHEAIEALRGAAAPVAPPNAPAPTPPPTPGANGTTTAAVGAPE